MLAPRFVHARLLVAAAIAVGAASVLAQQPAPPNRPPATASGLIVGRVIDPGVDRPVPGAVVSLMLGQDRRFIIADEQGRFLFRNLPKGSYSLSASRMGYVIAEYGKHWPGGTGDILSPALRRTLDLEDGEEVRDVTLRMWRRAEISGRVLDERGEPIVGVKVIGLTVTAAAGRRAYSFDSAECGGGACLNAVTDDRGAYRLSVIPGEYVLALPAVAVSIPLTTEGQTAGGVGPAYTSMITVLNWLGGGGGPNGSAMLVGHPRYAISAWSAGAPSIASLTDDGQLFVYESQFHSGATRLADAAVVAVGSGEDRAGVDFVLRPVRATRISGRLLGPDGPAGNVALRLVPAGQESLLREADMAMTTSDADGSFTFLGVPPGSYTVRVYNMPRRSANMALFTNPSAVPPPSPPLQWAVTPVTAGEAPLDDVTVVLRAGSRVSGRLEFRGSAPRPSRLPTFRLDRTDGRDDTSQRFVSVRPDGSFESDGHLPGRYLLRMAPPAGWTIASAIWNGRDVSDVPLEIGSDSVSGLVIALTDRPAASVAGVVSTSTGAPDPEAVVIAFPADRTRWVDFGVNPRRFRTGATDRRGAFVLTDMPAGDYLVVALSGDRPVHWRVASVLADLATLATRVQVGASGRETVNLVVRPR